MTKAVFLDRDGTLIKERHYLIDPAHMEFEYGVPEGLRLLQRHGFQLFMVTNQSGIARGYFTESQFFTFQDYLLQRFSDEGIHFAGYYYCPHHPTEGRGMYMTDCDCRKPKPGLINKAIEEFGLSKEESYMIGDKGSDIEAGHSAGLKSILVLTGYGPITAQDKTLTPDYVATDLAEAAKFIVLS